MGKKAPVVEVPPEFADATDAFLQLDAQ